MTKDTASSYEPLNLTTLCTLVPIAFIAQGGLIKVMNQADLLLECNNTNNTKSEDDSEERPLNEIIIRNDSIEQTLIAEQLTGCSSLCMHKCTVIDWSFLRDSEIQSLEIDWLNNPCNRSGANSFAESLPITLEELKLNHLPSSVVSQMTVLSRQRQEFCPNLERLTLTLCGLGGREASLRFFSSSLLHLNLSTNHIDDLQPLNRFVHLKSLSLEDNELGRQSLDGLLVCHPQLEDLNLSFNELGPHGLEHLASQIKPVHPLRRLNVRGCWSGHIGARHVVAILQKAKYLEELNLADNVLGDIGTLHVVQDGLPFCPTLRHLNVASNSMADRSAVALARVLTFSSSSLLESMNLSWSGEITSTGWKALALAVGSNKRIKSVNTHGIFAHSHPAIAAIELHLNVLRKDRFKQLLAEENSRCLPLILSTVLETHDCGLGLVFELLRHKPSIAFRG